MQRKPVDDSLYSGHRLRLGEAPNKTNDFMKYRVGVRSAAGGMTALSLTLNAQ
jgi:hypothetical protein